MKNFFVGIFAIVCFVLAILAVGYPTCWLLRSNTNAHAHCANTIGVGFVGLYTIILLCLCTIIPWWIGSTITDKEKW